MKTTKKQFVSDENVSVQLFNNKLLDSLTRTHIAVPVSMFILYSAGLLWWTKQSTALSTTEIGGLFFSGAIFFTFIEYIVHRYVYHIEPTTESRKNFQWKMHGVHHDYPKDKQRLAMPPALSVLVGTLLLGIFRVFLGEFAFAFLAGFMALYALYLIIHYSIHIFRMPTNAFKVLWVNHAIHHYSEEGAMFGVTSPLWDYIFGTVPKKEQRREIQVKVVSKADEWL
jgi:4-hydroxysphinganine ceramide fatty acyl 2-hydroxylase